jgi:hypothetical protein
MNDRFQELLAKGQLGRLSPAESEELAGMLNAPILSQPSHVVPGFVSKHAFTANDIVGRVRAIDWFAHLGKPLSLDLTMPVVRVGSWSEAAECCRDAGWENAQLEAQNQLTFWLHQHDRDNYRQWNEFVVRNKEEVITPLTDGVLLPYQHRHGLDDALVHSVQWDVLGALMENTYLSSGHWSFFFLELLWVYEAGHFPCGWQGEWPSGALLVY